MAKRKQKTNRSNRTTVRLNFNSTLAEPSAIEANKGIIPNIQIARIGEASGHMVVQNGDGFEAYNPSKHPEEAATQVTITQETLESLVTCAGERVKCLMNHSDDINEVAGVFKNFRVDGETTRADLYLLKSSKHHNYLLELSSECPEGFGVSVNMHATYGELDLNNPNKTVACICKKLVSCDLVTEPAATDGLFQVGEYNHNTPNKMEDNDENKKPTGDEDIATIAASAVKTAMEEGLKPLTESMTALSERMSKLEDPEKEAPEKEDDEPTEDEKLEAEKAKEKESEEKMSAVIASTVGAVMTKLGVKAPLKASVQNADDTTKLTFSEHVNHVAKTDGISNMEATKIVMGKFPDKHKSHLVTLQK